MAVTVQVSYPGVYIDEFAPSAPIEGVSTSVAAFIGVAERGPIKQPIRLTSLDEFTRTFGGVVDGPTPFYLAPSVEGFFRNGGFDCYIVRAATAANASETLETRDTTAQPMIDLESIEEGPAGDGVTVTVADASRLADRLTAAGAGATKLTFASSSKIAVNSVDATRRVVELADVTPFSAGQRLLFEKGTNKDAAVIDHIQTATGMVFLAEAIPPGTDYSTGATARIDDLKAGDTRLQFAIPAGFLLAPAVPAGTTLLLTAGTATADESVVVAENGTDTVTLKRPLQFDRKLTGKAESLEFDLTIADGNGPPESFPFLATDSSHPRYWNAVVESRAVRLTPHDPPPAIAVPDTRPAKGTVTLAGSAPDDPAAAWSDVLTSPATYLDLLSPLDAISIVAIPGATSDDPLRAMVAHCETAHDRVCVLDAPRGRTTDQLIALRETLTGSLDAGFGALYHPWLRIRDPLTREIVSFPPSGFVAGLWAKVDATRGVHKAPANVEHRRSARPRAAADQRAAGPAQHGRRQRDPHPARPRAARSSGAPAPRPAIATGSTSTSAGCSSTSRSRSQEGIAGAVFEPNDRGLWAAAQAHDHRLPDPRVAGRRAVRRHREGGVLRAHRRGAEPARHPQARAPVHRDRRPAGLPGRVHRRPHRDLGRRHPRSPRAERRRPPCPFHGPVRQLQLPRRDRRHRPRPPSTRCPGSTRPSTSSSTARAAGTPRRASCPARPSTPTSCCSWGMASDRELLDWHDEVVEGQIDAPQRLGHPARPARRGGRALELRARLADQIHRAEPERRGLRHRDRVASSSSTRAWSG